MQICLQSRKWFCDAQESVSLFEQLVLSILGRPVSEVTLIPVLEKRATQGTLSSVQLCSIVNVHSRSYRSSRNFDFCQSAGILGFFSYLLHKL